MVNPRLSKKVSSKIESLCAQGCAKVNQLLENAENGKIIVDLSEFNHSEIEQIIDELTQIMSVYNTDDNDSDASDTGNSCK